jgi:AcrR family transcriptional regulator
MTSARRLPAKERRSQLLDAAAELFATRGFARATTAELAKAAGVTEPIIYRHFASKKKLFIALIDRTGEETIAHWEKHLADAKDPAERLRRLLSDNPMVVEVGRLPYRVLMQAITEVDDASIRKAIANHFANLHEFLVREIKRAQEDRKVMKVFSAEVIAWILIHAGLGYGVLDALRVPGQGEDAKGTTVRDVFERLLVGRD